MFNVNEVVVYTTHGICCIDEICEKTYLGITKEYYVLHPIEDCKLKISTPVDNDKVIMLEILSIEEAEKLIESFKLPGIECIEIDNKRDIAYHDIVKKGNRKEISLLANTLMREKIKIERSGRRLYEKDKKLLAFIQSILFAELAYSLNITYEEVENKIIKFINENEY